MNMNQARNYVIANARYMDDAPLNASYFVRFPTKYSTNLFYSDDTQKLVKQIFNFGRTKEGRDKWNSIPKGKYDVEVWEEDCEEE